MMTCPDGSVGTSCPSVESPPPSPNAVATEAEYLGCTDSAPAPQTYRNGPWTFEYEVVNGQGLVLRNVMAGTERLFDSISIPHFKIVYGQGESKILRFCDSNDPVPTSFEPSLSIKTDASKGIDTLQWIFVKDFNEGNINGKLSIIHDIVIRWKEINNCEANSNKCFRFIPKVSFIWEDRSGSQDTLNQFTPYYRLDYGADSALALVKDFDTFLGKGTFKGTGDQAIQIQETLFNAVVSGSGGDFDNIHTAHVGQKVFIPGCRATAFDCIHMHWRWSDSHTGPIPNVDVLVEPSNDSPISESFRSTPYLVPGQTIQVGVIKYNPSESQDPDDPFSMVNGETIATASSDTFGVYKVNVDTADHPVVWYVASASGKNTDTFFRHGFFCTRQIVTRRLLQNVKYTMQQV